MTYQNSNKNSKKSGDGLPVNSWVSDEKDSGTSFEIKNIYYFLFGSLPYNGESCACRGFFEDGTVLKKNFRR